MSIQTRSSLRKAMAGLLLLAPCAYAFNSGSTGADGALTPQVNTEVTLPASGVLNLTTINIPTGVTVTFRKNQTNTPVTLLVSGDATVAGTLSVSGGTASAAGAAGNGNLGDDGIPGIGGPGGGDGGAGGLPGATTSQGGALLLAVSGTLTVTGNILSDGGAGGASDGSGQGGSGGGGSGGAIRIVATTLSGNGLIRARAGALGAGGDIGGSAGAIGRIRLEAENITRTAAAQPPATFGQPGPTFVAGSPSLRIVSVAGADAPASPSGVADITLPANTPNPVTIRLESRAVPVGNTVAVTITPQYGPTVTAISPALSGSSTGTATTSVSMDLPAGPSTISATTTYTVLAAVGDMLAPFAQGERVERVTLLAGIGQPGKAVLTTVSGREFEVSQSVLPGGIGG